MGQKGLIIPVTITLWVVTGIVLYIVWELYDTAERAIQLPSEHFLESLSGRASVNAKEITAPALGAVDALADLAGTNGEVSNLLTAMTYSGVSTSTVTAAPSAMVAYVVALMRVYAETPWIGVAFNDGSMYAAKRTASAPTTIKIVMKDAQNVLGQGTNLRNYDLDSNGYSYDLTTGTDATNTSYTPVDQSWYVNTVAQNAQCWGQASGGSGVYSDAESGNLVVSATVPLFASGTTTLLGIALADVRLSDTSSFISTLSMGVSGKLFIVENIAPFYLVAASEGSESTVDSSATALTSCLCSDGSSTRVLACDASSDTIADGWRILQGYFGGSSATVSNYTGKGGVWDSDWFAYDPMIQSTLYSDDFGLEWAVVVVIPGKDYYGFIRTNLWITFPVVVILLVSGFMTFHWYTHETIRTTRTLNRHTMANMGLVVVLWIVWIATTKNATDQIVEASLTDSGTHAQEEFMYFYDKHALANQLNGQLNNIGAIAIGTTGVSSNTALDSHFLTLLRSLRTYSNATSVYVGLASTGEMLGATVYNDVTTCVMTQAASSSLIYYGTTGSGSSETRDTANTVATYSAEKDARQTVWYTTGSALGQVSGSTVGNTGLTPVYDFEGLYMTVAVVTPFYDSGGTLLGVLGVDSTFDSANTILNTARTSTTASTFVAVERLAELVASATGEVTSLDSNSRLMQDNATFRADINLDMVALMEKSGANMTAIQNRTYIAGLYAGTATVVATRSASRYLSRMDAYFNGALARWTLVQSTEREAFYSDFDNKSFTVFSIIFFVFMFVLMVVMLMLARVGESDFFKIDWILACMDKRGPKIKKKRRTSTVMPESPPPEPAAPGEGEAAGSDAEAAGAAAAAAPAPAEGEDEEEPGESSHPELMSPTEQPEEPVGDVSWMRALSNMYGKCLQIFSMNPEHDIREMKPKKLLALTRVRLLPIVNSMRKEINSEWSTQHLTPRESRELEAYDDGAGVGLKMKGDRGLSAGNKLRSLDLGPDDSTQLKALIQAKAISYMMQADVGRSVFEIMTLESKLGRNHRLTKLFKSYFAGDTAPTLFVCSVLLYTLGEVAWSDYKAVMIPLQLTLNIYFTVDGFLMAYVEYLTDGFARDHLLWRVGTLFCMWVTFLYHVIADDDNTHNASGLLCPLLLIFRLSDMRSAASVIFRALVSARTVFYLLFFTVAVTAIMLNLFFYDEFEGEFHEKLGASADTFVESMVSMFVFLCSSENWEDLVFQGYAVTKASALFFLPFSIMGNFFLLSLVIATFQDTYRRHKTRLSHLHRAGRRIALASSFVLWNWDQWDDDMAGEVPSLGQEDFIELMRQYWLARDCSFQSVHGNLKTVASFRESLKSFSLNALCSATEENHDERQPEEEMANEIFSTIDRDGSATIEFGEFVLVLAVSRCVEMLRKRGGDNSLNDQLRGGRVIAAKWESAMEGAKEELKSAKRVGKSAEQKQTLQDEYEKLRRFFDKAQSNLRSLERAADQNCLVWNYVTWRSMDYVVLTLILTQSFALSLYGNATADQQALLYFSNSINLFFAFEMCSRIYSAGGLESYLRDARRPWTRMANLHQFILMLFAATGSFVFYFLPEVPQRVATGVISINLFRAFHLEEKASKLLYSFSFGFRPLLAFSGLFYILFYMFSWIAFQLFEGKIDSVHRNFNSFGATLLTMFQVFIGENWHEVMENTVRATTTVNIWFFVAYVITCRMFIADFMVGIVIDLFHSSRQQSESQTGQVQMIFAEHCANLDDQTKTDLIRSLGWVGSVIYQPVMKNLKGLEVLEHKFGSTILKDHQGDITRWAASVLQRQIKKASSRWRIKRAQTSVKVKAPSVAKKQDDNMKKNKAAQEKMYGGMSRRARRVAEANALVNHPMVV